MKELSFLVTWGKEKEKSWSGTNWSLYHALSQHYHVHDIDIRRPMFRRVLNKFFPQFHDMELGNLLRYRRKLKKSIRSGTVLQLYDICEDTEKLRTYVYKDLSVTYLEHIARTSPSLFARSGFAHIPFRCIERKANIEREYHAGCSGIFTMSHWLREFLIEHDGINPAKVHHVGGGINVDKSRIRDDARCGNKLLYIGRDFDRKGGDLVYEAFFLLKKRMSHVELHVAGPAVNPFPHAEPGYYYHGDTGIERLPDLLNKCDVFCMPSRFDAYGLVFPEALSYGLPCIGRRLQEMPYFIEEGVTGLLLDHDDSVELADKMWELLTQNSYSLNVRQRRDGYLKEYSWASVAQRISAVMGEA